MRSSADKFWKAVEGWRTANPQPVLGVEYSSKIEEIAFKAVVAASESGVSVTFKPLDVEAVEGAGTWKLDLVGAKIRLFEVSAVPSSARSLDETELVCVFRIAWDDIDGETILCTLTEFRSFGKPS